jgi:hypothetical protein
MANAFLNQTDFAKLAGVTKGAITQAKKEGRIIVSDKGVDPLDPINEKYVYEIAARKKHDSRNPNSRPRKKHQPLTKADMQVRQMEIKTHLLKVELEKIVGSLIPREQVSDTFVSLYSAIMSYFLSLPDRLTPLVVGACEVSDPEMALEVKKLLSADIERGLAAAQKTTVDYLDAPE